MYAALLQKYEELKKRNEELEKQIVLIGEKAVVDWDDPTVGQVDAVVKYPYPKSYRGWLKDMYFKRDAVDKLREKYIMYYL